MSAIAELYRKMAMGDEHESMWPEWKRRQLPWYDPYAIPYFAGDSQRCRHSDCPSTNWGGYDRVHMRGDDCPPFSYEGRHRAE